jgi:hypothetical protein
MASQAVLAVVVHCLFTSHWVKVEAPTVVLYQPCVIDFIEMVLVDGDVPTQ